MPAGAQATVEQKRAVQALVMEGCNAAQIYREMERRGLFQDHLLSRKTIERMVRAAAPLVDKSGPWSFSKTDPAEARLVVDVLFHVLDRSDGQEWLTNKDAAMVARIRAIVPSIPAQWAYNLTFFARYGEVGIDMRPIDVTLGARPWEGDEQEERWVRVLEQAMDLDPSSGFMPFDQALSLHLLMGLLFPGQWVMRTTGQHHIEDRWQLVRNERAPEEGSVDNNLTTEKVDKDGFAETKAAEKPHTHEEIRLQ